MTLIFPHYGLHFTESDIGLLLQDKRVENALDLDIQVEATVKPPKRTLFCPHQINLSKTAEIDPYLMADPIFRAMLPLPKPEGSPPLLFTDAPENVKLISQLLRLSSPSPNGIHMPTFSMLPMPEIQMHLRLTNIMPLVLWGYDHDFHRKLAKMIQISMMMPRRLVLVLPNPYIRVLSANYEETKLNPIDFESLPLEEMGAWALNDAMLSGKRFNDV